MLGQRLPPKESAASPTTPSLTPAPPEPDPPAEPHPVVQTPAAAQESTPNHEPPAEAVPSRPEETPAAPPAADVADQTPQTPLIKGLPVSSIDRMSVADNLFAAGETLLAADIYRQITLSELPREEVSWIEFQIANCDRRLGKIDEARKRYRRLVGASALDWVQDVAKWWLDALDEEDALKKEHARLAAAIQELQKATHGTARR
jgi:hypothetical protein